MTALDRPTGASRILRLLALPAGLAASTSLAVLLAVRLRSMATADLANLRVDQAVEIGILAIGAALTAWLALSLLVATACAAARVLGGGWAAGERLVHRCAPAVVRRTLVLAVGAGLGLSIGGVAHAADTDLGWAPTTATATATTAPAAADAAEQAEPATVVSTATHSSAPQTATQAGEPLPGDLHDERSLGDATGPAGAQVVVAPGDSLWKLAADALGPGASAAEIAAAWPRWHEANAAAIGADPGLIHPGQVLDVPAAHAQPPSEDAAPADGSPS